MDKLVKIKYIYPVKILLIRISSPHVVLKKLKFQDGKNIKFDMIFYGIIQNTISFSILIIKNKVNIYGLI